MKKLSTLFMLSIYLTAGMTIYTPVSLYGSSACKKCCFCATPCKTAEFCQTDGISLPAPSTTQSQTGTPSPSCLQVCGLPKWAVVKGLTVKLNNVMYPQANLLAVALVSPCGDAVVLLNRVGADSAAIGTTGSPATFCFSDCDGLLLSCGQTDDFLDTIKARPTDCNEGVYCFQNFDCCAIGSKLAATFCTQACGNWKLFACINQPSGSTAGGGSISSWSLTIDYCIPCEKPKLCSDCKTCTGCNFSCRSYKGKPSFFRKK